MKTAFRSQKTRRGWPKNRRAGFNMLDLLMWMVLSALLGAAVLSGWTKVSQRAHEAKAEEYQRDFNGWYSEWTTAGGRHNPSTSNPGQMAFFLVSRVMTGAETDSGIAKSPDSDGNWVDETLQKVANKSLAGAIRKTLTKSCTFDSSTNTAVIDGQFDATFTPTDDRHGAFTVAYRN